MANTGFIIDCPNALIMSGSDVYTCVTASSGQVQLQGSSLEIKGGHSLYDLISVPTGTSLTATLVDAQFDGDMVNIAFGAERSENATVTEYKFGTPYTISTGATPSITLDGVTADAGSVKINGMTESVSSTVNSGTYYVDTTTTVGSTVITFNADMAGKTVTPAYTVQTAGVTRYDILNTSIPKKGTVVLTFPVYTGDSTESAVTAYAQITIYSASINQNFTMGGSYKTASTFEVTIKGLDAKRPDKRIFSVDLIPVAA